MNTYEKYFTHQGCEYYLCTEFGFDHADKLQLAGFAMWRDGDEVSQEEFEANEGLYAHACWILANEDAPCYGGAPC
jgi:hypothetical protein